MTGHQIAQQTQYGRPKAPKKVKRPDREGNDSDYLAAIRKLNCCVCGAPPPSDAHHLKQDTGERGLALRSTDKWALPLCHLLATKSCHRAVEDAGSKNELDWFEAQGIDAHKLCEDLWAAWCKTRSVQAMRVVVAKHRS